MQFDSAQIRARIVARLAGNKQLKLNTLRAQTVSANVEGNNRHEFRDAFEEAIAALEREGVLVLDGDVVRLRDEPTQATPREAAVPAPVPVAREHVLEAMAQFDRQGRDAILKRYGFNRAVDYVVEDRDRIYDAKALYAIAYGIANSSAPPDRKTRLARGSTVRTRLEKLGFKVVRQRAPLDDAIRNPKTKVWNLRAGPDGEHEQFAKSAGVIVLARSELGEAGRMRSIERVLRERERTGILPTWTATAIERFVEEIRAGDVIVMRLREAAATAAIGIVKGEMPLDVECEEKSSPIALQRPVTWVRWGVPWKAFGDDVRRALASPRATIEPLGLHDEVRRIAAVVARIPDASNSASRTAGPTTDLAVGDTAETATDTSTPATTIAIQASGESAFARPPRKASQTSPAKRPDPNDRRDYSEPRLDLIARRMRAVGMRFDDQLLRRYHLALKPRGFVILAGVSGGGKTWLAEEYARAVNAEVLVVPVAPNWTTNEDLLGYLNPIDEVYHHTPFSEFLCAAAEEQAIAHRHGREPYPFHVVLDEMNLARTEHYFARILSTMELRARHGDADLVLGPGVETKLTVNLKVIGTVNVDETTFGFADKVYDRAQVISLDAPRDGIDAQIGDVPYRIKLLEIWDAVAPIAPFAYRVIDEIKAYIGAAAAEQVEWRAALDEQVLQKVLPKVKGADPRVRIALQGIITASSEVLPLSNIKARTMLDVFEADGVVSYF
jgi:MoxR-like ATPase